MAEMIRAVTPGIFPYARRPREKNAFSRWLSAAAVNSNEDYIAPPMLSLEDEMTLARLRDLPRPMPVNTAYARAAEITEDRAVEWDGQYVFDFLVIPGGGFVDREV